MEETHSLRARAVKSFKTGAISKKGEGGKTLTSYTESCFRRQEGVGGLPVFKNASKTVNKRENEGKEGWQEKREGVDRKGEGGTRRKIR